MPDLIHRGAAGGFAQPEAAGGFAHPIQVVGSMRVIVKGVVGAV